MKLQDKVALVTGGSRGIGRAIALGLGAEGADVAVNYVRNKDAAEEVVDGIRKMGRKSFAVQADTGSVSEIYRMTNEAWDRFGRIDILVNNAGVACIEPYSKVTEETWDRTLDINLKGVFFCSQAVALKMVEHKIKGKIINISATNGQVAEADTVHYNASKGGVNMVTRSLAIELALCGINVNAVAPGIIATEIDVDFFADPKFKEYYLRHIPQGRFGTAAECVGAVVFLASEDSAYINGEIITIDGGLIIQQVPKLQMPAEQNKI